MVISLALSSAIFQAWLFIRYSDHKFHGWGAILSLATAVFTFTSLIQYSSPSDYTAIWSEKFQYATFPLIAFSLHGFSIRFFNRPFNRLDKALLPVAIVMVILPFAPDLVLTDVVVDKRLSSLVPFYPEPKIGPLGLPYIALCYLAAVSSIYFWVRNIRQDLALKIPYLVGLALWLLTALHDVLVTLGMPTYMYLMSYGVLGFNIAVIFTTIEDYFALKQSLEMHRTNLETLVRDRTVDLEQINRELSLSLMHRDSAEKALRESEQRFKKMADLLPIPIGEFNFDYRPTYLNQATFQWFGYTPQDIQAGLKIIDVVRESDREAFMGHMDRLAKGENPGPFEINFFKKDGSVIFGQVYSAPIEKDGRIIGVRLCFQDLTDRRRQEEQINRSLAEKNVLLRELHHRVKNNMQVIISLLNLQSRKIEDKKQKSFFFETQNRIYAIAAVHETLHLSEDLTGIDLNQYLTKLSQSTFNSYRTDSGNVKLAVKIESIQVSLEKSYPIGLVINELLSNALKYAFPDGRRGNILVGGKNVAQGWFQLSFEDDGIGLNPDSEWNDNGSLGLQIVRNLIESQLQGEIRLDASKGTKFEITLPY